MNYKYSFEKLEVWQQARKLTKYVYEFTRNFPEEEKFGLTSQMRRSAISICSNLAEGNSRVTNKDRANFFMIAYSSSSELLSQMIIAYDLGYIDEKALAERRCQLEEITNKINSLRKKNITEKRSI